MCQGSRKEDLHSLPADGRRDQRKWGKSSLTLQKPGDEIGTGQTNLIPPLVIQDLMLPGVCITKMYTKFVGMPCNSVSCNNLWQQICVCVSCAGHRRRKSSGTSLHYMFPLFVRMCSCLCLHSVHMHMGQTIPTEETRTAMTKKITQSEMTPEPSSVLSASSALTIFKNKNSA